MLKKLISTILCTFALTAVCANAETTLNRNKISFDENAEYRIAAVYDAEYDAGSVPKLCGVQIFDTAEAEIDYPMIAKDAEGECTVKIYSWDGNLAPVSDVVEQKVVAYAGAAFDEDNSAYDSGSSNYTGDTKAADAIYNHNAPLCFNYLGDAKKYNLSEDFKLYVNGNKMPVTATTIQKYIIGSSIGNIVLTDENGDELYDNVYTKYAPVAYVLSGLDVDDEITLGNMGSSYNVVQLAGDLNELINSGKDFDITINGEVAQLEDLRTDDVVTVEYDVTAGLMNSSYYRIDAIRGSVTGKCISGDTERKTYTLYGGEEYRALDNTWKYDIVGFTVELYVDKYNRIIKYVPVNSGHKYAVLEDVYTNDGQKYFADIIRFDGTKKTYEIMEENEKDFLNALESDTGKKTDYERVITYKTNSAEQIHTCWPETATVSAGQLSLGNIGAVGVNKHTEFLEKIENDDGGYAYKSVAFEDVDKTKAYSVYAYDLLPNGKYGTAILSEIANAYKTDSQMAVFMKTFDDVDGLGNDATAITVMYDGEEKSYILTDSAAETAQSLDKGDVILFKTDEVADINEIFIVAKPGVCEGTSRADYNISGYNPELNVPIELAETDIKFDFGVIIDKTSDYFSIVDYGDEKSDSNAIEYELTDETKIYVYSYREAPKSALFAGNKSNIIKTAVQAAAKDDDDNIIWEDIYKYGVNYAFVRADDDEALELFVIISPNKEDY